MAIKNINTDVNIIGNLTVEGTTTSINTTTVEVKDNILQLNTTPGSPDTATAATSGISIYRGNGVTQASLIFDDADDTWDLTNNIVVEGSIKSEGPDGGMVMRTWQANTGYGMIGTANMASQEYALITNGADTFIGGGAGGFTHIRSGNNDSNPQLVINGTNSYFDGGNLGVGTSAPGRKLEVAGDAYVRGEFLASSQGLVRANEYDNGLNGAGEIALWSVTGTGWNVDDGLGRIRFYTNDGSGIGARDVAKIEAVSEDGNDTTTTTPSGALAFYTSAYNANVVEAMRIDSSGNIGIGTTSPGYKLSVQAAGETYSADFYQSDSGTDKYNAIRVRGAMTSTVGYYGVGGSTTSNVSFRNAFVVGTQSAHSLNLATSDTARMTITSTGNVGIGTTSPVSALQVAGDILPSADNTGVVGNTDYTWADGQFTNLSVNSTLTVASTLNVRSAIDLADSDILRFGSSDDFKMYYDGAANEMEFEMEATCNQIRIHDNGTTRFTLERATGNLIVTGDVTGANLNISNWNTAYGWGNHADAGYLDTESDTLDTVTSRGSTTSNQIALGPSSTAGGRFLSANYSGDSRLGTLSSIYSSGNLFLGYGLQGNSGSAGYVSSYGNFSGRHGGIEIYGKGFRYIGDTTNSQTAIGTLITTTEFFKVDEGNVTSSGDIIAGNNLFAGGSLFVGGSNTNNYIAFRGTTGDQPGNFNHTYIGEYLYGGTEQSELILFKGNDPAVTSGPDRIRYIGSTHVFQTYTTVLNGTFTDVATSALPVTRLHIDNDGKVGIGTDQPTDKLHVVGNIYATGNITGANLNISNWNTAYGWGNHADAGYLTSFSYTETDPVYTASSWYTTTNNSTNWNTAYGWGNHANAGYLTSLPSHNHDDRYFTETESDARFAPISHTHSYLPLSGGTLTGSLTVQGTGSFTGDVIAYASSDMELKDNIIPISNAIDKVKAIGGYEFDWNNKQHVYEGHDVGVIAQEIEAVLPEVVITRESGHKAVKYEKIVPLLIEAIKDQQKQIDELKALINGGSK